jgi:hypothetical protein
MSFRGSVSRIGGMSLADLQAEAETFWAKGFPDKAMSKLEDYGFIQSRPKGACCSRPGAVRIQSEGRCPGSHALQHA